MSQIEGHETPATPLSGQQPNERHVRKTPMSARGEPMIWLMGMALSVCLILIVALVGVIIVRGSNTFWVRPIEKLTLQDGSTLLAMPYQTEQYDPSEFDLQRIEELRDAGTLPEGTIIEADGEIIALRQRFMVGNRAVRNTNTAYITLPLFEVVSRSRPSDAVLIERTEWGPFLGLPAGFVDYEYAPVPEDGSLPEARGDDELAAPSIDSTPAGRVLRLPEVSRLDGKAFFDAFAERRAQAGLRRDEIDEIKEDEIPSLQQRLTNVGYDIRKVQYERERTIARDAGGPRRELSTPLWAAAAAGTLGLAFAGWLAGRKSAAMRYGPKRRSVQGLSAAAWVFAVVGLISVLIANPFSVPSLSAEDEARKIAQLEAEQAQLSQQTDELLADVRQLESEDARFRVILQDPASGATAPESQSEQNELLRTSQIVRVVRANELDLGGKVSVYLSRWREYLTTGPREIYEGGVYPVIVGTVTLTLLLTVSVVPLGVIGAIYLREYARQGLVTSMIRIAINNLAGVPSIVYGMFGLGFFCYTLGKYIDGGPGNVFRGDLGTEWSGVPLGTWWGLVLVLGLVISAALGLGFLSATPAGREPTKLARAGGILSVTAWLAAVCLAFGLIATTPYFGGFFREKLPESPTFGGKGILWAALTLALLTLPVVIVATEEAIAAVPRSMREGSYGCGASRWQTIKRIVLPSALPGIMTGAILAMARGAGEVAPLMLVGALNQVEEPPISGEAPFLHGDRPFMHLGFHIYSLGFQAPDSEATQPMVWTTTLLLISIVLLLNLTAITLRARLRNRLSSSAI